MPEWKINGDDRRKLFHRYVDLQMRSVQEAVFKYIREVRDDLCIGEIMEDIPDIMLDAFWSKPKDEKVANEMRRIFKELKEKEDGSTDEIDSLSRPEQVGFN